MTEVRSRGVSRPILLVALVALFASLVPAPAEAQTSTDWDPANACPSTLPDSGFTDATGAHGHNIDCLAWFELTNGITATSYGNLKTIRRDQTASFVVRSLARLVPSGFDLPARDTGAFSDVTSGPHRANIETLAGFDPSVAAGYRDGTFGPQNPVTRAQFASIIVRSLDHAADQGLVPALPAASSPFTDTRGSVHEANIARLANAGIVKGKTSTSYDPDGSLTRGQAASILARVLGGLVDEGVLFQPLLFTGVVHDATDTAPDETGDPIADARITASGITEIGTRSGSDGSYALWLQQPGAYTIDLSASGFVPQQRSVVLPDPNVEMNLGMYPQAIEPVGSTRADATPLEVSVVADGDYWKVDLPFDATTAAEARLKFPGKLVITLGQPQAADLYFSRHRGTGTSDRVGADSGVHTVYYDLGAAWQHVEAEFDANGTLVSVNGTPYTDLDATS
jgi:hypothetical protein